jgi:hypothetical protein
VTAIIDAIFSSGFLIFTAIIILIALFIFIWVKSPLNRLNLSLIAKILYFSIPVIIFLTLFQFPFGLGYIIHDMLISNSRLIFYDCRPNRRLPRLNVVNADTGDLIYRTHFTQPPLFYRTHLEQHPELFSIQGEKLLMRKGTEFLIYDIQSRKEAVSYSYMSLMNNYNEFSGGVDKVIYDRTASALIVQVKHGRKYYIEPYSGRIQTGSAGISSHSRYGIYSMNSVIKKNNSTLIYFYNSKNSTGLKVLKHADAANKNSGIHEFLEPDFLFMHPEAEIFIIRSYERTDKENFILTAFNMNIDKLRQTKRSDLKSDDSLSFMLKRENHIFPILNTGKI